MTRNYTAKGLAEPGDNSPTVPEEIRQAIPAPIKEALGRLIVGMAAKPDPRLKPANDYYRVMALIATALAEAERRGEANKIEYAEHNCELVRAVLQMHHEKRLAEAERRGIERATKSIMEALQPLTEHGIPYYAYGDHEAACALASCLDEVLAVASTASASLLPSPTEPTP